MISITDLPLYLSSVFPSWSKPEQCTCHRNRSEANPSVCFLLLRICNQIQWVIILSQVSLELSSLMSPGRGRCGPTLGFFIGKPTRTPVCNLFPKSAKKRHATTKFVTLTSTQMHIWAYCLLSKLLLKLLIHLLTFSKLAMAQALHKRLCGKNGSEQKSLSLDKKSRYTLQEFNNKQVHPN